MLARYKRSLYVVQRLKVEGKGISKNATLREDKLVELEQNSIATFKKTYKGKIFLSRIDTQQTLKDASYTPYSLLHTEIQWNKVTDEHLFKITLMPKKIFWLRRFRETKQVKLDESGEKSKEQVIRVMEFSKECLGELIWEDYLEGFLFNLKGKFKTINENGNFRYYKLAHLGLHAVMYQLYEELGCRLSDFKDYVGVGKEGNLILALGDYAGTLVSERETLVNAIKNVINQLNKGSLDKLIFDNPMCNVEFDEIDLEGVEVMKEILEEVCGSLRREES